MLFRSERYDGYLQLENGVGMLRLLMDEFQEALEEEKLKRKQIGKGNPCPGGKRAMSLVTGMLAFPYILDMARKMENAFPDIKINVYGIVNDFFGERITVSGLLTGQDIERQLKGKELGERILLPENVLRSGERVFLDDITVEELEKALQVKVDIVKSSGRDFVNAILA